MKTANAQLNTPPFGDAISAMQNILTLSQVIIPNLETPYIRFPNTDHSTTILEGQNVFDIIAERQQQLDTVLHEISDLEVVMDGVKKLHQQLVQKKKKIIQSMNLHKGLVSPLSRFPNELLAQIFHHCFPNTSPKTELWCQSKLKAPMRLVGICRRWREVATSTPSLWCRLHVEVDDEDWQRAAFCYESWLKWSRGLPLSLVVKCSNDNHSTTLRRLLHPYMSQISSLSIFFFPGAEKPELLLTDLPTLEELTIFFNEYVMLDSVPQLPPKMRRFTAILPLFHDYRVHCLSSMWAHLTDVGIGTLAHVELVLELLQLCPNLSSLTIRGLFHHKRHTLQPLKHPKIQCLRIDHRNSEAIFSQLCELLSALSLPNLRFLELRSNRCYSPELIHEVLRGMLKRSKCPLQSLMFGGQVELTDEQRAEYITLIPSLEIGIVEEEYFTPVEQMALCRAKITSFYCTQ